MLGPCEVNPEGLGQSKGRPCPRQNLLHRRNRDGIVDGCMGLRCLSSQASEQILGEVVRQILEFSLHARIWGGVYLWEEGMVGATIFTQLYRKQFRVAKGCHGNCWLAGWLDRLSWGVTEAYPSGYMACREGSGGSRSWRAKQSHRCHKTHRNAN